MKKRLAWALIAALLFAPLTACGKAGHVPPETADVPPPPIETVPPAALPTLPEETAAVRKIRYIYVKIDGLNLRAGPGTEHRVLGQAQKNILLGDEGEEGGWLRTSYRGKTAYVSKNAQYVGFFSMEAGSEEVEKIISEGVRLLGTPYVYGAVRLHDGRGNALKGFTTDAFDCSSLMQYIFYCGAGIVLDVTTRTQAVQGLEVPRSDIRRGDLLFFTNASRKNRTGLERIGHVALYLGENYILHTASDLAKIEEISPARWENFITARRMTA